MNNEVSNKDSQAGSLHSAFLKQLPGRISAIIDNWHLLVRSNWDAALLTSLLERVRTLTNSAGEFGMNDVWKGGKSLLSHLAEVRESSVKPQQDDLSVLDGLVHAFLDLVREQSAVHEDQPETLPNQQDHDLGSTKIYLLDVDVSQMPGLLEALNTNHYKIETLVGPEPLTKLKSNPGNDNHIVISHIDWLQTLYPSSHDEGLWLPNPDQHGLHVTFVSETNDLHIRLKAMRTDAKAYWTLPTDAKLVIKKIKELVSDRKRTPCKVLLIDDDPTQSDFSARILTKSGFECMQLNDPFQALEAIEEFKPHLILMDLYMPGATGAELTQVIREKPDYINVPIVFLSGEHDLDIQLKALSFGGEDFLAKPIDPKQLVSTVHNRIRRSMQIQNIWGTAQHAYAKQTLNTKTALLEKIETVVFSNDGMEKKAAVLYIEIDQSSDLIKVIGIGGMDYLIAEIHNRLRPALSNSDMIAHFGDNSLGLLIRPFSEESLVSFGNDLVKRIAHQPFSVNDRSLKVTVSIGAFIFDNLKLGPAALFGEAMSACNQVREDGGNGFLIQTPKDQNVTSVNTHALEILIKKAIESEYFEAFFQPIVDLKGDSAKASYQCLIRIREPKGRLLSASVFIPTAEKMGIIGVIDQWMFRTALKTIHGFKTKKQPLRLFLPHSIALIEDMARLSRMNQKFRQGLISKDEVILEFRYADVKRQLKNARLCFEMLKKMNIEIALTGIGKDPDVESILELLPVSYIKLTTSLFEEDTSDLLEIIGYAGQHEIKVIAPQVEDPKSVALLWGSGADYVQGNFVQQPQQNLAFDFKEAVLA